MKESNKRSEKYIVLGVSFEWGYRKGQDVFNELRKHLDDSYIIVLVGTDELVDKEISEDIITIRRTKNCTELAEIYTAADVFINPTRDEALGMVNIESLACGTPVVTFAGTGSGECVDEESGKVVKMNDIDEMVSEIIYICKCRPFSSDGCKNRASFFNESIVYADYINLYNRMK